MSTPGYQRSLIRIVVIVVVLRQLHIVALAHVALVLLVQGVRRILQVSGNKELSSSSCHHDAYATFWRLSDDVESRHLLYVLAAHLGMAAMRHIEDVIKASEDRLRRIQWFLREDAEHLLVQLILRYSIEVIESRLRTPADIERRGNVGTGPVEYLSDFVPILHILILHCLDRCTCHNHAIKLLLRKFVEILVEHHHVLNRRILGSMTLELHEIHLQLQRGVGEQTHQVGLGGNLKWHEIEYTDFQRSDFLTVRTALIHHEDILMLQQFDCWQLIR